MATHKNIITYLLCFILSIGFLHANSLRNRVKNTYESEIGTKELTGKNDGVKVEEYLKAVNMKKGFSWCAAFVSWTLNKCGISNPRSAWAPSYFSKKNTIYQSGKYLFPNTPAAGDVFGIYFPNKKRIAHVGFIDSWGNKYAITVEGNTNEAGSREGDGVYKKRRLLRQIYSVSTFIN